MRGRKLFLAAMIAITVFVTITINLSHTDAFPRYNPACPACSYHCLAVATAPAPVLALPQLTFLRLLAMAPPSLFEGVFSSDGSARASPSC